jgi:hypothetical protein
VQNRTLKRSELFHYHVTHLLAACTVRQRSAAIVLSVIEPVHGADSGVLKSIGPNRESNLGTTSLIWTLALLRGSWNAFIRGRLVYFA